MGDEQVKRELKIGTLITYKEREKLITLVQEYINVFTWFYKDMTGLDTDIIVYRVPLMKGCKPIKQKLRKTHIDILIKVKAKIKK